MAPTTLNRDLDQPSYSWILPAQATILNDRRPELRIVTLDQPGSYTFSATVRDARGHTTTSEQTIDVLPVAPLEVRPTLSYSNPHHRAPLTISVRAAYVGGHPSDSVEDYQFSLNGQPIEDLGTFARIALDAGTHTVTVALTTRHGKSASVAVPITVTANQAPTCTGSMVEYRSSRSYTARCQDADGRVVSRRWSIDGVPSSLGGGRITIPKSAYPDPPSIELIAVDDSGAESIPLTSFE